MTTMHDLHQATALDVAIENAVLAIAQPVQASELSISTLWDIEF